MDVVLKIVIVIVLSLLFLACSAQSEIAEKYPQHYLDRPYTLKETSFDDATDDKLRELTLDFIHYWD